MAPERDGYTAGMAGRPAVEAAEQGEMGVQKPQPRRINMQKVEAIIARSAARPILDSRTPDEIIDYDKFGLPR
jgi:hypothetical protein